MTYWARTINCVCCNKYFRSERVDNITCSAKCYNKWYRRRQKNSNWYNELGDKYKPLDKELIKQLEVIGIMYGSVAVEQCLDVIGQQVSRLEREIRDIRKAVGNV